MSMNELNQIAKDYHLSEEMPDKFIEDISQHYFCNWLKSRFHSNLRVCEMGYGEGITTDHLGKYFDSYTVVEGAEALSIRAQQENANIAVVHSMFEDYQPQEQFDLILALHVLEHVNHPQSILKQMKKWLKPGGSMLALVPNKESLHRQFAYRMSLISKLDELSERDLLVGHKRVYDLGQLAREVEQSGLAIESKFGFFLKPVPNSMMIEYSSDLIWELNTISPELEPNLLANICVIGKI